MKYTLRLRLGDLNQEAEGASTRARNAIKNKRRGLMCVYGWGIRAFARECVLNKKSSVTWGWHFLHKGRREEWRAASLTPRFPSPWLGVLSVHPQKRMRKWSRDKQRDGVTLERGEGDKRSIFELIKSQRTGQWDTRTGGKKSNRKQQVQEVEMIHDGWELFTPREKKVTLS